MGIVNTGKDGTVSGTVHMCVWVGYGAIGLFKAFSGTTCQGSSPVFFHCVSEQSEHLLGFHYYL